MSGFSAKLQINLTQVTPPARFNVFVNCNWVDTRWQ